MKNLKKFSKRFSKSEKGQSMIEFALVIPLFIIFICLLIDFGWISYQKVMFDYTVRYTGWDLRLSEFESWVMQTGQEYIIYDSEANQLLENQFRLVNKKAEAHINLRNVSISNGQIAIYPGTKIYSYTVPAGSNVAISDRDRRFRTTSLEVEGRITYEIQPITPISKLFFKNGITLSNTLYKARRIGMRIFS